MQFKVEKQDSVEKDIVEGCLKNDRQAQYSLYQRYCDAMYTICYRITGNYDDANEALQEAFIQVFTDLHQFKFNSTLGAWIKTIVVRTAIRIITKERKLVNADIDEVHDDDHVVIPSAIDGELLEQAILSLPDGYRTVFLLVEVEGYTHEEVAKMLNIAVGTSKSQLFRAKKLLQKKIGTLLFN
ncbi:MAG: RNA polymerase sigma factor [Lentimicrobiaceae bacterium]|nr:RNA polymerase sigma factor [Lentimicrobiaceae bacterium]